MWRHKHRRSVHLLHDQDESLEEEVEEVLVEEVEVDEAGMSDWEQGMPKWVEVLRLLGRQLTIP